MLFLQLGGKNEILDLGKRLTYSVGSPATLSFWEGTMPNRSLSIGVGRSCVALALLALIGCAAPSSSSTTSSSSSPSVATKPETVKPQTPPAAALPTIRVKAGLDEPLKDSKGTTWAADTGYDGGENVDRADLQVTGTDRPELYRAERYSMESYHFKVPNGDYTLKLHFSEDYDGLSSPTDRMFIYTVKDGDPNTGKTVKEVKDFSPWKASGAQFKAYVDAIPVTVTTGELSIKFTPEVENPQINAIEILPR